VRACVCACACVYHIIVKSRRDDRGLISSRYFPNIIKNLEYVLE
jgi:hypothetical protein